MKNSDKLCKSLAQLLKSNLGGIFLKHANMRPCPITIKHLLTASTSKHKTAHLDSFNYLRREVPIRLANIMKELELMPESLLSKLPCVYVQENYIKSYSDSLEFVKSDIDQHDDELRSRFSDTLHDIRMRHLNVVPEMAEAAQMCRENLTQENYDIIQTFFNRLFMSRISIHMLIHQYNLVFGNQKDKSSPNLVGCIDPACDVSKIIHEAYENASFLCEQAYLDTAPLDFQIQEFSSNQNVTLSYVPAHLHYILFELLKNALRATVEKHENEKKIPAVQVRLIKTHTATIVKIRDFGGGVHPDHHPKLFHYMFTTAESNEGSCGGLMNPSACPMAGLGYGLPVSLLYARYFRGDIHFETNYGVGSNVTLYLKSLSTDSSEIIPFYNGRTTIEDTWTLPFYTTVSKLNKTD